MLTTILSTVVLSLGTLGAAPVAAPAAAASCCSPASACCAVDAPCCAK